MKNWFSTTLMIVAFAVLAFALPQEVQAAAAMAQGIQGEVMVAKASAPSTWNAISQDTALETGDSLKTTKGSCALVYGDQATFTVDENTTVTIDRKADFENIQLLLGKIKGKVKKEKVEKPFQVSTPAAVATVRGTEVDFGFNEQGQLTVDLHNGKIEVVNEAAEMKFDLEGKKSISLLFDPATNVLKFKNDCGSDGAVTFSILGAEYSEAPCSEREVALTTAEQGVVTPDVQTVTEQENPDEGREPITETQDA